MPYLLISFQPVATVEDAAWMNDLLGEVDTNLPSRIPIKTMKTASRRKTRVLSPPISQEKKIQLPKTNSIGDVGCMLNTPPMEKAYDDDAAFPNPVDDYDALLSDPLPSSPVSKAVERKGQQAVKPEVEDDDMMEIAQVAGDPNVETANVNMSGSRPAPKISKEPAYPSPESSSPTRPPADAVDPSAWDDVTSKLNVLSSQGTETTSYGKIDVQHVTEEDGSIRMFWTDYTEINGCLCFFGKVKDKKTNTYVSTFMKVDNILRKLYFLPRTYRQSKRLSFVMSAWIG